MDTAKYSSFISKCCLLTAGNKDKFNSMTIGWGSVGRLWNKSVCTVYVRKSRYTYSLMEENDVFTISFLKDEFDNAHKVMGSLSGRDVDKVKEAGLTPVFLTSGVTYKEAELTFVCRKIHTQDLDLSTLIEESKIAFYSGSDEDDIHRIFTGEIIDIIE